MADDDAPRFFRVKNWDKYQDFHHKTRKNNAPPPWIKLSTAFFDDAGLADLPDSQRLAWVAILISAAQTKNRIPFNAVRLQRRFSLGRKPDLQFFMEQGFIEKIDVESTSQRREEEEKTRGEYVQASDQQTLSAPKFSVKPATTVAPSMNRDRLVADGYALVGKIAAITGEDPTQILARATEVPGKCKAAFSLDGLSDTRLAYTLVDLRKDLARVQPQTSTGGSGEAARIAQMQAERARRLAGE